MILSIKSWVLHSCSTVLTEFYTFPETTELNRSRKVYSRKMGETSSNRLLIKVFVITNWLSNENFFFDKFVYDFHSRKIISYKMQDKPWEILMFGQWTFYNWNFNGYCFGVRVPKSELYYYDEQCVLSKFQRKQCNYMIWCSLETKQTKQSKTVNSSYQLPLSE